jgi:hypothetical protein
MEGVPALAEDIGPFDIGLNLINLIRVNARRRLVYHQPIIF